MPIYEYSCQKCGQTIEVIQKMSDPELDTHEGCGGSLTKLISAAGFQFKGSGWYITDYARKSSGAENTGNSEPSTGEKKDAPKTGDGSKTETTTTPAAPAAGAKSESKPKSGGKKD